MGPHFMLLLSIYILYSNVTYIYPVSCLVEIKLFQIVSHHNTTYYHGMLNHELFVLGLEDLFTHYFRIDLTPYASFLLVSCLC